MRDPVSGSGTGAIATDDALPVERAFLIADVRGYTSFTRERGDAEAARLASGSPSSPVMRWRLEAAASSSCAATRLLAVFDHPIRP